MSIRVPDFLYHITETANVESIMRDGLLPLMGRRASELNEDKTRVYLFDSLDSVTHAHWFWEDYEDDEDTLLTILTISSEGLDLTPTFIGDDYSWEWTTQSVIPASHITIEEHLQESVS